MVASNSQSVDESTLDNNTSRGLRQGEYIQLTFPYKKDIITIRSTGIETIAECGDLRGLRGYLILLSHTSIEEVNNELMQVKAGFEEVTQRNAQHCKMAEILMQQAARTAFW